MYHVPVQPLAQRVLSHIRRQELLHAGDRIGVAVSGGIDSVALLRLMLELRGELGIVLSVVHFNHKLRGAESDADEQFVADLAREHGLEFRSDTDDVAQHATDEHISVEAAARELRYGFFHHLLGADAPRGLKPLLLENTHNRSAESAAPPKIATPKGAHLDKIATGHTLDDQAETVLMRMIRGSGTRGLGGIYPRIVVEDDDEEMCGEIIRPLLAFRRRELQQYLFDIRQSWREDSTNADDSFTRNRVRQLVVPLLENEFNPAVAENLAELADIARAEEDYWENEVAGWMGTAVHWSPPEWAQEADSRANLVQIAGQITGKNRGDVDLRSRIAAASWLVMNATVDRLWFLGEPRAVQRRLVKAIGEHAGLPLEFKHVEEILRFAIDDQFSGKELALPLGWKVALTLDEIIFLTPDFRENQPAQEYDYELPIPGKVSIREIGSIIEAQVISVTATPTAAEGYNSHQLLNAASLPRQLRVRNWRPGDRFWPAQTKSPKKIKELLQERHVPQSRRRLWPVVVNGDEIVWMRGFPVPAVLRGRQGEAAILITESSIADSPQKQAGEVNRSKQ
jgi:tRNA(Ile)-lysidine synthase